MECNIQVFGQRGSVECICDMNFTIDPLTRFHCSAIHRFFSLQQLWIDWVSGIHPKLIGPDDELETMSKQQGMKEVFELETFTNQDPSTLYHIFQKLGTPWPYFVSLQGDNNILRPLFRDTQSLIDLTKKHLLQSYTLHHLFLLEV